MAQSDLPQATPPAQVRRMIATTRGGPDVLRPEFVAPPPFGDREVLVRTEAAGVLIGDVFWQRGLIPGGPKPPFVPGYDVVGRVVDAGRDVQARIGRRVAAIVGFGGYASHVVVANDALAVVPDDIDAGVLSSLVMPYVTARRILVRVAEARPGATLLVHGGSGATGSALLDLARALDLRVWATAGSGKRDVVERYGARFIDRHEEDFAARLARDVPGGVDIAVDPIGGPHFARSFRTLAPGGRLVATAAMNALQGGSTLSTVLGFAGLALRNALPNGRRAAMFDVAAHGRKHPEHLAEDIDALAALLHEGRIDPLLDRSFPLDEAAAAQERLLAGKACGRVWLVPDGA